jgi:hypothetical protein
MIRKKNETKMVADLKTKMPAAKPRKNSVV